MAASSASCPSPTASGTAVRLGRGWSRKRFSRPRGRQRAVAVFLSGAVAPRQAAAPEIAVNSLFPGAGETAQDADAIEPARFILAITTAPADVATLSDRRRPSDGGLSTGIGRTSDPQLVCECAFPPRPPAEAAAACPGGCIACQFRARSCELFSLAPAAWRPAGSEGWYALDQPCGKLCGVCLACRAQSAIPRRLGSGNGVVTEVAAGSPAA